MQSILILIAFVLGELFFYGLEPAVDALQAAEKPAATPSGVQRGEGRGPRVPGSHAGVVRLVGADAGGQPAGDDPISRSLPPSVMMTFLLIAVTRSSALSRQRHEI